MWLSPFVCLIVGTHEYRVLIYFVNRQKHGLTAKEALSYAVFMKVPAAHRQAHSCLWPWEKATLAPADLVLPGWLPLRADGVVTLLGGILGTILLPAPLWPLAWVLARLAALDLTLYILPDIYTIPLLAVGLTHALQIHAMPQFLAGVVLLALQLSGQRRLQSHFGGGDFKLLAAMLAWLPLQTAAMAVAVGCIVWLPLAFWRPKAMHPFGLPLILGWLIILAFPHLPEWLLRPMLGG
jgi:prepilin signal peptidase PulO-like enzyme (type II secretory pathway)